ncbi:hypothetical protein K438DRAFT_1940939 [Mycena galopus ATCC 62051]|nr:hypothetical protein K438DRAFT_1940939 [Mycena galopus ATCC 62051]
MAPKILVIDLPPEITSAISCFACSTRTSQRGINQGFPRSQKTPPSPLWKNLSPIAKCSMVDPRTVDIASGAMSLFYCSRHTAFREAPELRDVHFSAKFSPTNIDLSWLRLTTVRIDSSTIHDCLLILLFAPRLQVVTYRFLFCNAGGPVVVAAPLLHLKSLIFRSFLSTSRLLRSCILKLKD